MAEIKVLALDLDGTLTNSQKEVTPRTRAALDAAIAKGVTIVLASGRPTAGVLPLAKELGLDALVEVGPGKALSGFVKKTVPELPVYAVETAAELEQLTETLKGASL